LTTLRRLLFALAVPALAAVALAACGDDDAGPTGGLGGADLSTELELVARNILFDTNRLEAPANTTITLTLDNRDAGVLHNFALYRGRDAREPIFRGDLFAGVETKEYEFRTPRAGSYFFRCDVHPDTMTGSFVTR
jgi:plastocyanin